MKRLQKGICMEVIDGRSVFMLTNGQFVQGKPVNPIGVGEEGSFYPLARKSISDFRPFVAAAIAVVAIMMLVLTTFLPQEEAYAYVQVQVNPGVEIGIDKDNRVVSMSELNEDGIKLIEELGEWKDQPLEEVLNRVLTLAPMEMADELIITTVSEKNDPALGEIVETTALAVAGTSKNSDLNVHLKKASQEQRNQAAKENVPVGQLVKDFKKLTNRKKKEDAPLSDIPPAKPKQETKPKEKEQVEKKPANPPVQEKKNHAPGQVKKKETPPAEKEKKPPGQEKKQENKGPVNDKKEAPGQVKKENPGQQNKKEKPEKQQNVPSKSEGNGSNGNKENKGNGKGKE